MPRSQQRTPSPMARQHLESTQKELRAVRNAPEQRACQPQNLDFDRSQFDFPRLVADFSQRSFATTEASICQQLPSGGVQRGATRGGRWHRATL